MRINYKLFVICMILIFTVSCKSKNNNTNNNVISKNQNKNQTDKINITNVNKLNKTGLAFYRKKQYRQALKYFQKILEIKPDHQEAIYNCACMNALLKKPGLAVMHLDRLFKINPGWKIKLDKEADFRFIRNSSEFKELKNAVARGDFNGKFNVDIVPENSNRNTGLYIIGWGKNQNVFVHASYEQNCGNYGPCFAASFEITDMNTGKPVWKIQVSDMKRKKDGTVYKTFEEFWTKEKENIKANTSQYEIYTKGTELLPIGSIGRYGLVVWSEDANRNKKPENGFSRMKYEVYYKYQGTDYAIYSSRHIFEKINIIGFYKSPFYNSFVIVLESVMVGGPETNNRYTFFKYINL